MPRLVPGAVYLPFVYLVMINLISGNGSFFVVDSTADYLNRASDQKQRPDSGSKPSTFDISVLVFTCRYLVYNFRSPIEMGSESQGSPCS